MNKRFRSRLIVLTALASLATVAAADDDGLPPEDDRWIRITTEHFESFGDAAPRKVSPFPLRLEQLRETLAAAWGEVADYAPVPTQLFVFRNRDSFEPYVFRRGEEPAEVAGYFLRTASGNYVAIDASAVSLPYPTIYHEYMHYVLGNGLPGLPLWLEEGLAEFYSSFSVKDGTAETGRPIDRHLEWLRSGNWISLDQLFETGRTSDRYDENTREGAFYAQSWLLVHSILTNPDRAREVGKLIASLQNGDDPWTAFDVAYGIDGAALSKQLREHLPRAGKTFATYTLSNETAGGEPSSEPVERPELLTRLGELLIGCCPSRAAFAKDHLDAALALDPDHVDALLVMAELDLAGNEAGAAAALCARAAKLDPDNARAYSLRGEAVLRSYRGSLDGEFSLPATPAAQVLESRALFGKALSRDADDLRSLIGFGTTFLFQASDLTDGVEALERAYAEMPAREDLLFDLIVLQARAGGFARAAELLDTRLRPRGVGELAAAAEREIFDVGRAAVSELIESGENAEAVDLLTELTGLIRNPELKATLVQDAESLSEKVVRLDAKNEEIELFNRAARLTNEGRLEEALPLFDRVVETASNAELVESARATAEEIRGALRHQEHLARFDAAVQMIAQEKLDAAAGEFEALLEEDLTPELRERVSGLLSEIRRHAN